MKILHYQHMGVGVILSRALLELGVESRVLASARHPFGFKEDFLLYNNPILVGPLRSFVGYINWRQFYGYDILHSHDNLPLPKYVLKKWHKCFIQHYHDPKTKAPLYDDVPSFVSLPNLLKVIPDATWVPLPVDTRYFKPQKKSPSEVVRVGFSDQGIDSTKGSFIPKDQIKAAVEKSDGKMKLFPLTSIIDHGAMLAYYNNIDIWVDRIGHEFYGFSAIEVAAMGKPVITQIGEEEMTIIPECPFINITLDGVTETIITLMEDEMLRKDLGRKARDYVVEIHDARKVARLCIEKYKELLET